MYGVGYYQLLVDFYHVLKLRLVILEYCFCSTPEFYVSEFIWNLFLSELMWNYAENAPQCFM